MFSMLIAGTKYQSSIMFGGYDESFDAKDFDFMDIVGSESWSLTLT
jgi:hypothetical protein